MQDQQNWSGANNPGNVEDVDPNSQQFPGANSGGDRNTAANPAGESGRKGGQASYGAHAGDSSDYGTDSAVDTQEVTSDEMSGDDVIGIGDANDDLDEAGGDATDDIAVGEGAE